jgi:hypothetical protein
VPPRLAERGASLRVVGPSHSADVPVAIYLRFANAAKAIKFRTCGRWYLCDTLLKRLAQDLQEVAPALRPFIQQEHSMVRQTTPPPASAPAPPPIKPTSEMV